MKDHLSPGQIEIARDIADDLTVKVIAAKRCVSVQYIHQCVDQIVLRWNLDPTRNTMTQIARRYREITSATAA